MYFTYLKIYFKRSLSFVLFSGAYNFKHGKERFKEKKLNVLTSAKMNGYATISYVASSFPNIFYNISREFILQNADYRPSSVFFAE